MNFYRKFNQFGNKTKIWILVLVIGIFFVTIVGIRSQIKKGENILENVNIEPLAQKTVEVLQIKSKPIVQKTVKILRPKVDRFCSESLGIFEEKSQRFYWNFRWILYFAFFAYFSVVFWLACNLVLIKENIKRVDYVLQHFHKGDFPIQSCQDLLSLSRRFSCFRWFFFRHNSPHFASPSVCIPCQSTFCWPYTPHFYVYSQKDLILQ